MGCTACTEPQCLYKGALSLLPQFQQFSKENIRFSINTRESVLYSYRHRHYFVLRLAITTTVYCVYSCGMHVRFCACNFRK